MKLNADTIIDIELYQSKPEAWTCHYLCIFGQAGPKEWSGLRGGPETSQSGGGVKNLHSGKILIGAGRDPGAGRDTILMYRGSPSDQPQHSANNRSSYIAAARVALYCCPSFLCNTIVLCFQNPVFWFRSTWSSLKEKVPKWLCFEQCCMVDILIH